MAGGTPGQVGGGGGGGGGGLQSTANADFSQNALNTGVPGGDPSSPNFVGNAMTTAGGGGAPAAVVGTQADPANQSTLTGLYASTVNPETTPTGQRSGSLGNIGEQIGKFLFGGSAQAATPSRPGGPAGADAGGAGWFSTQRGGVATDPYGNTYTAQPGYQASPMSPLPPARPQPQPPPAPAATAAPAPAPAATPTPPSRGGVTEERGGGKIPATEPTPTAANTPLNQTGEEPPPAQPQPPFNQTGAEIPPAQPTDTFGQRYGNWVEAGGRTAPGGMVIPPPEAVAAAPRSDAAAAPRDLPQGAGGFPNPNPPQDPLAPVPQAGAPISPQSATVSGDQTGLPQGAGGFPYPNAQSPLEKLIRGDFSGFMRDLLGQQGVPRDQNFAGLGTPQAQIRQNFNELARQPPTPTIPPGAEATARAYMAPGAAQSPTTSILGGGLPPGVPPQAATTAQAYQMQNPPQPTPPTISAPPANMVIPGSSAAPGAILTEPLPPGTATGAGRVGQEQRYPPRGSAGAATSERLQLGQPNQTPQQTERIYQAWLKANKLQDSPGVRTRFNIENGTFRNLRNQATPEEMRRYIPGGSNPPRVPRGGAGAAPAAPPFTPANPAPPLPPGSPPFTPRGDPGGLPSAPFPDDSESRAGRRTRTAQAEGGSKKGGASAAPGPKGKPRAPSVSPEDLFRGRTPPAWFLDLQKRLRESQPRAPS